MDKQESDEKIRHVSNISTYIIYSIIILFIILVTYFVPSFIYIIFRIIIAVVVLLFIGYNIFKSIYLCESATMDTTSKEGIKRIIKFGDQVIPRLRRYVADEILAIEEEVNDIKNDENVTNIPPKEKSDKTYDNGNVKYCYLNTENSVRNCMSITNDTQCISGEIFPSMHQCVNPNIRP